MGNEYSTAHRLIKQACCKLRGKRVHKKNSDVSNHPQAVKLSHELVNNHKFWHKTIVAKELIRLKLHPYRFISAKVKDE